jgi:hypothetical protein
MVYRVVAIKQFLVILMECAMTIWAWFVYKMEHARKFKTFCLTDRNIFFITQPKIDFVNLIRHSTYFKKGYSLAFLFK